MEYILSMYMDASFSISPEFGFMWFQHCLSASNVFPSTCFGYTRRSDVQADSRINTDKPFNITEKNGSTLSNATYCYTRWNYHQAVTHFKTKHICFIIQPMRTSHSTKWKYYILYTIFRFGNACLFAKDQLKTYRKPKLPKL